MKLQQLYSYVRQAIDERIFHAICTGRIEGWNINGKQ